MRLEFRDLPLAHFVYWCHRHAHTDQQRPSAVWQKKSDWHSWLTVTPLRPSLWHPHLPPILLLVDHVTRRNSILSISIRGLPSLPPALFGMWCKCLSSTGLDAMYIPRCGHRPTAGAGTGAGAGSGLATIGLKFNFWLDFNVRGDAGRVDCEIRLPSQFRKAFPLFFPLSLSFLYPQANWETAVELVNLRQYLNKFLAGIFCCFCAMANHSSHLPCKLNYIFIRFFAK